jgi:hypothetical protein
MATGAALKVISLPTRVIFGPKVAGLGFARMRHMKPFQQPFFCGPELGLISL